MKLFRLSRKNEKCHMIKDIAKLFVIYYLKILID